MINNNNEVAAVEVTVMAAEALTVEPNISTEVNIMEKVIIDFAKSTRIARAKAEAFADAVIRQYRRDNPPEEPVLQQVGGRPVSSSTLELREVVYQAVRDGKSTTEDIAKVAPKGTSKLYICNALNYLEKQGKVIRLGKDTSKVGRGKKPVIWGIEKRHPDNREHSRSTDTRA